MFSFLFSFKVLHCLSSKTSAVILRFARKLDWRLIGWRLFSLENETIFFKFITFRMFGSAVNWFQRCPQKIRSFVMPLCLSY